MNTPFKIFFVGFLTVTIVILWPLNILSKMDDMPRVQPVTVGGDRASGGGGGCDGGDCHCKCLNDEASCLFWATLLGLGPSFGYIWCGIELYECYDDCGGSSSSTTGSGGGGGGSINNPPLRLK